MEGSEQESQTTWHCVALMDPNSIHVTSVLKVPVWPTDVTKCGFRLLTSQITEKSLHFGNLKPKGGLIKCCNSHIIYIYTVIFSIFKDWTPSSNTWKKLSCS